MFNVEKYFHLEWKADSFCCGDYVQLILADELGLVLPPIQYTGNPRDASRILASIPYRKKFSQIQSPKHMCVVEMRRFRDADHVGVCVDIMGTLYITHCEPNSGVALTTFSQIKDTYTIVGYYEYTG